MLERRTSSWWSNAALICAMVPALVALYATAGLLAHQIAVLGWGVPAAVMLLLALDRACSAGLATARTPLDRVLWWFARLALRLNGLALDHRLLRDRKRWW